MGRNDNPAKPKANLVQADDIIVVVISMNIVAGVKEGVIESGDTRYICANKDAFVSYTKVEEREESTHLGGKSGSESVIWVW